MKKNRHLFHAVVKLLGKPRTIIIDDHSTATIRNGLHSNSVSGSRTLSTDDDAHGSWLLIPKQTRACVRGHSAGKQQIGKVKV